MIETHTLEILVVIVNYKTADLVIDCLTSLQNEKQLLPGLNVIVSDNASGDDSINRLQKEISLQGWNSWIRLMPLPKNGGFSYGNNEAVRVALKSESPPDMVLLLNPDTIVRPGAVANLVEYLEGHPEAAMIGSRLEDPDGTPQRSAFRFITPGSEFLTTSRIGLVRRIMPQWETAMPVKDKPHNADWLAGASLLIRPIVFDKIGFLDESYFLYFEEVDFCLRANRAGMQCWYVPSSQIVHLVGAATGISHSSKIAKRRPAYWFESRRNYFLKNWGRMGAVVADLNWIAGFVIYRLRLLIERRQNPDPPYFFRDFLSHSVLYRGFRR